MSEGRRASEYLVVEFDPSREPEAKPGKPSPRQLELLTFVRQHGTVNGGGCTRKTIGVIFDRGWVCHNITADGQEGKPTLRLTAAGRAALSMSDPADPAPELCKACMQKRRAWWAQFRPPPLSEHDQIRAAIEKLRLMTPEEQLEMLLRAGFTKE